MKKRLWAVLLSALLTLSCAPGNVFAADSDAGSDRTPDYTFSQYAGKVGQWGAYRNNGNDPAEMGPQSEKVDGIGGSDSAIHITGGPSEGGYLFSFNDGNFLATRKHGPDNAYSGAIDASEFVVTYKSNKNIRVALESDYRLEPKRKYTSNEVTLEATNGETVTKTIPLSDFEEDENGEWIYNLLGKYQTTNFNPVVTLNVHAITNGCDVTFEQFAFNWYEEDMVSGLTIQDYKTEYYQNHDEFDYSQGTIGIKRGGSNEVSEYIPLDDLRVTISGFKNTALTDKLTLTATVLNKTIQFDVAVVEYKPNDIKSIRVNSPKTEYLIQEDFDFATGSVTAVFGNGTEETVNLDDPNVEITGFDSSSAKARQTITVNYGGLSTTYTVSISEFTVSGGITVENPKKLYRVGDSFDWHTGTIVPKEGTPGKLFSKYATVTGFDSSAPAEGQIITVSYGGETTTYTIDIIEDEIPIKYKLYQNMSEAGAWKWGSAMTTLGAVEGKAENGEDYAIFIEGDGTHGGGGAIVFLSDKCGSGQITQDDGTVLDGFIGADAMVINYTNTFTSTRASNYAQYKPVFSFRAEYQNGTGTTATTQSYALPVTKDDPTDPDDTGYWEHDFVIDFREIYDNTDKSKETAESIDWLYNMKTVYNVGTGSYAPSIQWRFNGKLQSGDILAIDKLYFAWYEDEPVESIQVVNAKTKYNVGEAFDMNGKIKINYKNGTQREVTADYMKISGFDTSSQGIKTITLSYAGKSVSYDIRVEGDIKKDITMSYQDGKIIVVSNIAYQNAVVIMAAYNGNVMTGCDIIKTNIAEGSNELTPDSFDITNSDNIKLMLWENENTLCECIPAQNIMISQE